MLYSNKHWPPARACWREGERAHARDVDRSACGLSCLPLVAVAVLRKIRRKIPDVCHHAAAFGGGGGRDNWGGGGGGKFLCWSYNLSTRKFFFPAVSRTPLSLCPVVGLTVWTQGIMNKYSSPPPCRTRLLLASRSEVSTTAVGNEGRGLLACVDAGYDQYGGGRNDWGGTCMYEHMSSGLHRLLGRASERAAQKRNRLCTALKSSPQPP